MLPAHAANRRGSDLIFPVMHLALSTAPARANIAITA
jgi:hypothetical protein